MTPADKQPPTDATAPPEPQTPVPAEPRESSPVESRETSRLWARESSAVEPLETSAGEVEDSAGGAPGGTGRRRGGRWVVVVGLVLVIAAAAGLGLGVAIALPGWLPGPPVAPGPAQPSYVIGTQASPAATQPSAGQPAAPSPTVPAEYTVEPGDTLRSIAENVYGDANLWPTLYDANRDTIGVDPDAVRVGMRLHIPPR